MFDPRNMPTQSDASPPLPRGGRGGCSEVGSSAYSSTAPHSSGSNPLPDPLPKTEKAFPCEADQAQARAILAKFIAALFAEPTQSDHTRLAGFDVRLEVTNAASVLRIEPKVVDALFNAWPSLDALLDERYHLLGHTVRSTCPPYELEYGSTDPFQQSQRLADIAGFYRAFGLDAAGPLAERGDHFVAEWEFLAILAFQGLHAPTQDDAACCRAAQGAFLREHAAVWMPAFFSRIERANPGGFLACVARLAQALLSAWCGAFGVAVGSRWLELRQISDEDSSISCGGCATSSDTCDTVNVDHAQQVELGPTLAAAMNERT